MHRRQHVIAALGLVCFLCSTAANAQSGPLSDLDAYVEQARRAFDVPGIAVTVVKDDRIVLERGFGVRRMGAPAPVDAHTLFGIASNTKAFTAAALAILVDDGKIRWNDRVIDHLPSFQMYDPYVTREMTVRDLLTHRSGLGLGAGDLLFFPHTTFSSREIVRRLRFIKPATSFRSRYAYDNVLYLVAGQLLGAVTGGNWAEFIHRRIFEPLGMRDSNTSVTAFRPGDNVAIPHIPVNGRIQPADFTNVDNNAPAGAINSCVADLARWIVVQLNRGDLKSGGTTGRLFSQRQSREMWSPQTIIPPGKPPAPLASLRPNFSAYGLGWRLLDYRGRKIVTHTGGLPGYVSRVTLVPDLKLGIAVLTNQQESGAFQAVTTHILDAYLGAPPHDWIGAFLKARQIRQSRAAEVVQKSVLKHNAESRPSLPLSGYAGTYRDAWYGPVSIVPEKGKLVLRFAHTPGLVGDLEHWQYDTFIARWRDRSLNADAFVTFSLNPDGSIARMKMAPVSPLTDFSFDFQDLLFRPVKKKAAASR